MSENIIKKLNVNGVEYNISSSNSEWKNLIFSQLGLNINTPDMPGYLSVIKVMTSNNYNGQTAVGSGNTEYGSSNFYHPFDKSSGTSWIAQDNVSGNQCYLQITGVDKSLYPEIGVIEYNYSQYFEQSMKLKIQGFTGTEWVDLTETFDVPETTSGTKGRIDFTIDQSYKDVGIEYYKLVFPTADALSIPGKGSISIVNWNMFKSINK